MNSSIDVAQYACICIPSPIEKMCKRLKVNVLYYNVIIVCVSENVLFFHSHVTVVYLDIEYLFSFQKPRNNTPCFYENQSTGCQKPHCVFMHYKPRNQFGTITSAQNTGPNATDANAKEDDTTPASRSSNNNSPAAEIESPRVEPLVVNPFEEGKLHPKNYAYYTSWYPAITWPNVQWHLSEGNFTRDISAISHQI